MTTLKVFIYGITGKMGKEITAIVESLSSSDIKIIGGSSSKAPSSLIPCDVAIDFSLASGMQSHLEEALSHKIPLFIGTTGLTLQDEKMIIAASQKIPILHASNTSIGITVLSHLVKTAAQLLDETYDIEIFETHHRHKKDAPSGTSLTLASSAAQGRNIDLSTSLLPTDREGSRPQGSIGVAVHRGGGVFGEHSVRFIGDEEVIELNHRSLSRRLFARGALKAAQWLANQKPGLYEMKDVFLR